MIKQAIVLAAGLGTRLKPLTDNCPKPMLDVRGKPLLIHNLLALERAGINHIVIHVSYLADLIISQIADGKHWGLDLNITYAKSLEPLESGGGIQFSLPFLLDANKPFISVNSDIFTDYDYNLLSTISLDGLNKLGHLVLVNNPSENTKGDYNINYNHQTKISRDFGMLNKNPNFNLKDYFDYTYSGIAVYHPNLLRTEDANRRFSIVTNINSNIDKFTASFYGGKWHDIGDISRYNAINNNI